MPLVYSVLALSTLAFSPLLTAQAPEHPVTRLSAGCCRVRLIRGEASAEGRYTGRVGLNQIRLEQCVGALCGASTGEAGNVVSVVGIEAYVAQGRNTGRGLVLGALIGAGVGAIAFGVALAATEQTGSQDVANGAIVGFVGGTVVGAIVGAAIGSLSVRWRLLE